MDEEQEIEQIRRQEEHRLKPALDFQSISEDRKIARVVLELAKYGDVKGFRHLLIDTLGMKENGEQFSLAMSEFWNVVREFERRVREKP